MRRFDVVVNKCFLKRQPLKLENILRGFAFHLQRNCFLPSLLRKLEKEIIKGVTCVSS